MASGVVEEGTFQAPPGYAAPGATLPFKDRTGAVKVAAGLNLAWGGLLLLGAVAAWMTLTTVADMAGQEGEFDDRAEIITIRDLTATALTIAGTPYLVGGAAVFARQNWGRPLLFGVSGLGLLLFPLGTIISIVSFWALTRPGAEPWFGGRA